MKLMSSGLTSKSNSSSFMDDIPLSLSLTEEVLLFILLALLTHEKIEENGVNLGNNL